MSPFVVIGLCLLSTFEITVSPDQPLPFSYTDDPLIVEIRSDTPGMADIQLTATPDYDQPPQKARFEKLSLGPGISRWCALKNLSSIRGPWTLEIAITMNGSTEALSAIAHRIDRPADTYSHAIYAYGDHIDRSTLLALRGVAVDTVRIPITHPNLKTLLETLQTLNMNAVIGLSDSPEQIESARSLNDAHCDVLSAWALDAAADTLPDALEALRSLDCQKPVRLVLPDAPLLDDWLDQVLPGQHLIVQGRPRTLAGLREGLAIRGLHGITVEATVPTNTIQTPHRLLPLFFEYAAHGAQATAIPAALIYADGTLQPGLSRINGLIHRIAPGSFAGSIAQPGSTRTRVFSTGKRWLTVAWRTDDISTIELPWSDRHPFSLTDEWGNGLESNAGESNWVHPLTGNFLYITGLGGPVLRAALVNRARTYARQAIEDTRLKPAWSTPLWDTLNTIAADPADVSSRVQFFALLRAFPDIEKRWHTGQITRPVATTALARLAALARTLCQLEAALGASFLEPLQDTLARCEEFQSAYLTGSTTTPQARARGDWLVTEVRHLMDEAEALAQVDRRIEADAVAALAEWRARALEFAAKAGPQSDQLTLPEKTVE